MATPGSPYTRNRSDIVDALKKHKGVLSKACKEIDCHRETLYRYIKDDKELSELLVFLRNHKQDEMADEAEDTVFDAMQNRSSDMNNALKAAMFFLNSKGEERGYKNTHTPTSNTINLSDAESKKQLIETLKEALGNSG